MIRAALPATIDRYRLLAFACLLVLTAGTAVGIAVPAGLGWDFANFYDTGRRAVAGELDNLYDAGAPIAGEPPQGRMRFWGTPLSAWFYAPLAAFPPETALVLFKIAGTLAVGLALVLLYRHLRAFAGDAPDARMRFAGLFCLAAVLFQPFWTVYRVGGQTTPVVLLLLMVALLGYSRDRAVLAASALGVAVAMKPAFVVVPAALVVLAPGRMLVPMCAVGAIGVLASVVAAGWEPHVEFLRVMVEGTRRPSSWHFNSSLYTFFDSLRVLRPPDAPFGAALRDALQFLVKLLALAGIATLVIRSRRRRWSSAARRHFEFVISLTTFLMLSQVLWEHYLSALFVIVAYVLASARWFSRGALRFAWGICLLALLQNLILVQAAQAVIPETFMAILAASLVKSGPLILTAVLLWGHQDDLFASYEAPVWTGTSGLTLPALRDDTIDLVPAGSDGIAGPTR